MDPIAFLQKKWQSLVANATPLFWTAVSIVLVAAFLFFFYSPPQSMIGPEQPIPFSHRLHVGHKTIQCQYCHPYVGHSNHPGLPPVEKCLHCHNYIIANHPWIKVEHRYFNTQTSTPWTKVNYVAEHVLFNHQRHINGQIACRECHGLVENSQRLPAKIWRMGECVECHRKKKANLDCWLACHS